VEINRLTITGQVIDVGSSRVSPAGVPQRTITIEHRSRQLEAGAPREARCQLKVKIAGEDLVAVARAVAVGQQIGIEGFLTRSGFKGSETGIVMHATRIRVQGFANEQEHG